MQHDTILVKKSDVEKALIHIEKQIFNGRDNSTNPNMTIVLRIMSVFTELYHLDLHPEESLILKDSYQLLKTKGYYYNVEEEYNHE